ncbi:MULTISPECIES: flagellar motor switch protein FliM [Oceanobacillus]|uniref:Flagellar motor switch protein FliM n=1 Tax=Oceanobacillus indicireducens TaxID=1004261 RepID=A0A918CYI9_9BACI|nr:MULTISPECIES: flagellar motor switch protein FliM [Oceanobacillus]GGN49774.1 flagellar motor switch protein FliM [Oceanobacillus indicireducens]
MEEILSQNEIDVLLSAITSGEMDAEELKKEEEEKKIRVYDFKRALRFSKDQIRSISRIHENYARMLTTFLSSHLRTYVHIAVTSVDQVPYEEFVRSISSLTVLNLYSMSPLKGNLLIEVNPNVAYALLDRTLGGKGTTVSKTDSLTEIEVILLKQIFEKATYNLKEAWSTLIEVEPVLEEFEENPQFIQMVAPNDTVVVVSMSAAIGETTGMINLCIPHTLLEPIIPKLSAHYWMDNTAAEPDENAYRKLSNNLQTAEVDVRAILGETTISINEFLKLQSNDIIALNQQIENPLLLTVNEEPKFYVQAGKQKRKIAVQVLEEIKKGVNAHE